MKLLELFRRETTIPRFRHLFLAGLSGIANAGVLAVINVSATNVAGGRSNVSNLFLFALAIGVFVVSQRHLMAEVCREVEALVHAVRVRLLNLARRAEFLEIEEIGRADIHACLSRETQVISQAAPNIVIALQAAILVLCTMVYMAILSMTAFLLSTAFTLLGAWVHLARSGEIKRQLRDAYHRENAMMEGVTDMLDGFKEIKMGAARSAEIAEKVERLSREVADLKTKTQIAYARDFVFSQVTFFILTGLMVFVVPLISQEYVESVVMTTTATLFMIGPISNVVGSLSIFSNAESAAESLLDLEERLSAVTRHVESGTGDFSGFRHLVMENATFRHRPPNGEPGFAVGPINLTIERGSTVFVTGGNGSGKSTFMRMLMGLYPISDGTLRVDDARIDDTNLAGYRDLFSVVFSDNHLFPELYGVPSVDPDEAAELLDLLEMRHKAGLIGRVFSTIKLSGGQRKRLALVAAILEKRSIYLFDEWAADQDPHLREKFYRVILPRFRAAGMTVIAVTHDDKYFNVADVHLHMEDGKIVETRKPRTRTRRI